MENERSYFYYSTPFGTITISQTRGYISALTLSKTSFEGEMAPTSITNRCATEVLEYFSGKRTVFDLPVSLEGTSFQKEVWSAIQAIPYGQTRCAKDIAQAIGNVHSYRLVGQAARECPIALVVPSHRIVSANGYYNKKDPYARMCAALRELEQKYR